jgi:hypothetical protein
MVPRVVLIRPPSREMSKDSSPDGACLYWMITWRDDEAGAAAASGEILLLVAVEAAKAEVAVVAIRPNTRGKRKRDIRGSRILKRDFDALC